MDVKTESWVKFLLLILVGVIIIQFVIIVVVCSCDYIEYKDKVARYEAERKADTLHIVPPQVWQTDYPFINDDFHYER